MKRLIDLAITVLTAPLWMPLLFLIAGLVRLFLGAPVLFRQDRAGLGGRAFKIVKFRTMSDAVDDTGALLPDADRLPAFGRWLRATSLDEVPEVWNVLVGDMSIVGPRPLLLEYLPLYSPDQARRHEVRPGMTGWAQINGRNAVAWPERFALDVWYVDHQSVLLDLRIMFRTVWRVIRRQGITSGESATMAKFSGNSR